MPIEVGDVVAHYRVDQVIARGRATIVFAATDLRLGRPVALKVLNDASASDEAFRRRFSDESHTAARLGTHPHIVTVFDADEWAGSVYFVTQFVDGVSLQELLRRRPADHPLPPAEAVLYLRQVAGALDYAHRNGVIHRDVKPANIMIDMTETPHSAYLIDFGITKRLDVPASGVTSYGLFVGTADYASPEQIRAAADIDRRSDVYSLACTAFEMLTGHAPYDSAADDAARIAAHLDGPIPCPTVANPRLPAGVDDVFATALAKDRTHRYESCAAFVDALAAVFPAAALEYRRPLAPGSVLPPPGADAEPSPGPRRRHRMALVLAAVAAVVVAAAVTVALVRHDAAPSATVSSQATIPSSTIAPTTVTPTTVTPTTAPVTTAPATTAAPATTVPPTARGPFGDVVGDPVAQPTNAQGAVAFALQARRPPAEVGNAETPTFFYAEWLRLTAGPTAAPVVATRDGYQIDTGVPADLTGFDLSTDGKVRTFTECTDACRALTDAVRIVAPCAPGPNCIAFASDTGGLVAVQRATITLRGTAITLMFSVTAPQPVVSIGDATGVTRFDPEAGYMAVTLPTAPPAGTETVATVTFADGSTSKVTVTYG